MTGRPAARVTDLHTCPMVTGTVPHVGGPVLPPAATNVLIGNMPAARVGDLALCVGPPDAIVQGSGTVFIANQPAARMGDATAHGGVIVTGFPTVLIGDAGAGGTMAGAAAVPDPELFRYRFERVTGLSVEEIQAGYFQQTGQSIDEATLRLLFSDSKAAQRLLSKDKTLHQVLRNLLNTNIPRTEAHAEAAGYIKLSFSKSIFHNPISNSKYVARDGHLEAVFDGDGTLVESEWFKGTFNFFGPDNVEGHTDADVRPYFRWRGN